MLVAGRRSVKPGPGAVVLRSCVAGGGMHRQSRHVLAGLGGALLASPGAQPFSTLAVESPQARRGSTSRTRASASGRRASIGREHQREVACLGAARSGSTSSYRPGGRKLSRVSGEDGTSSCCCSSLTVYARRYAIGSTARSTDGSTFTLAQWLV